MQSYSERNGSFYFYHQGGTQLFCDNETNNQRMYNRPNDTAYVKDGINNYVVNGQNTVNPALQGTKAAVWFEQQIEAGGVAVFKVRLSKAALDNPWQQYDEVFDTRLAQTHAYYQQLMAGKPLNPAQQHLLRSAFGGLLWTKQFYYFDVFKWLFGEPEEAAPLRHFKRNYDWQHLTCRNIISMPDKWEYPWFAAWDLAFHAASFVHIDPEFAKQQLLVFLREYYMHPNGQIPAYEWNFSDVNPPVHAWGVWYVFEADRKKTGVADWDFLERAFQKLLMNFTWWVNQKDANGTDIFEGGFLGLDNIGVFDRNHMPPGIKKLEQADATSWMAMYAINMLRMSLELAEHNKAYEESAAKFFRHFLNIGWAMHHIG
ncbi:MAG TPA: glucosidase, partial [Phnomibacter sp.]|nr:glucosidase [Phnomibacter sp.]